MAEFKLGRIRFVWKDAWVTGSTYYKDDVVRFGGKIYICVVGHTAAADFFTDFDITPPKWNLVSDGQSWRGDWAVDTNYIVDDIVAYGARLYICNENHTSAATTVLGLEADQSKWNTFAEGLDWKGDWAVDTQYKVNDIVKYGGYTYVCNTAHTSAATTASGLEADQSKWDYFNKGIDYRSVWASTTRYKAGDVIQYGSGLWICTTAHTSSAAFSTDSANWEFFVQGFQFEGEWDAYAGYQEGDVVRYGGNTYISLTSNTETKPTESASDWQLFSQGIRLLGEWGSDSTAQEYRVGELVTLGGYTYICTADHSNQQPPNANYWQRLTSGLEWRGEWLDDQEYYLGDVVRYGANTYVCVLGHISEGDDYSSLSPSGSVERGVGSRPDQDDSGLYWNILAIGNETAVMTTKGDLVYYASSGPARLPIGKNGQVLTVSADGIPEWAYLGDADDVYYVAEHGVNSPAPDYGKTIDRPWASIRYACEQVEKGTKNPNARMLLEMNRYFIQREIVEWTDYQITNNTSPFTTSFTYDSILCERDMGLIVDAIVWDITHGGNVRSREAALQYVNNATGVYTKGQEAETVASINYGLSVINKVLDQVSPSTVYQVENGDNSTAIVEQWTDASLEAEAVQSEIAALVKIITDAITAGVATNIPERLIRSSLIRVSTGKYYETLPIIVPAETCILGDELRSTNVQPRKTSNSTLTPSSDTPYSFKALERIEGIVGDVLTGVSVTPTTGNTELQTADFPLAESEQAQAVERLVRTIKRRIDHGVGNKIEATLPKLYDLADINYGYARDLMLANKEFIQAEIIAYIADLDSTLKYSKTKCKQDVGYILDAIAYDLSYGGNWQSTNAGLAYYEGNSLNISTSEKSSTIAAYGYLKSLIGQVARNITVTAPYQTAVTQVNGNGGSAGAVSTIDGLIDDIVDIVTNGSGVASITYPSLSGVAGALTTAKSTLEAAEATIKENVIDFINTNFGTFNYDGAKCRRDAGILQTDSAYDIALGTNYNAVRNGLAYRRGMSVDVINGQLVQTVGAIAYQRDQVADLLSDPTGITRNTAYWNEVIDIVQNGPSAANSLVFTDTGVAAKTTARTELQANRAAIISDLTTWIASNYPSLVYDSATCERDTGYIVDALSYDIQYGGNSATYEAARAYYDGAVAVLPASQQAETAAAFTQLKTIVNSYLSGATEETEAGGLLDIIINVISTGLGTLPSKTYPDYAWAAAGVEGDADAVLADTAVVPAVLQYITNTYSGFVYDHAKCSRDVGLILDAAIYDWCLNTNFASIVSAYAYLRFPSRKVVGDQKDATIAANEYLRQLARANVGGNATAQAGIDTTIEWVNDMIFGGSAEGSMRQVSDHRSYHAVRQLELNREFIKAEVHAYVSEYFKATSSDVDGVNEVITVDTTTWMKEGMPIKFESIDDSTDAITNAGLVEGSTYYVKEVLSDTTFTISSTVGGSAENLNNDQGSMYVRPVYAYNQAACSRDVDAYIDAIKWDMIWPQEWKREYTNSVTLYLPSNYKSRLAARYYVNSVIGSQEEDMYYLRNGTGLRMQTLDGLQGDLGPANAYGTSRPTAGAYASLDPGWGPNDERVWITARSPYVQNCTTFGYAAVGQKIDGALHNGGNDSIVSNDFTQVISDGIGAWITNNGRAELVSVFTYYSHIGYLAENGGRIRGTNGNCSYGDFGAVAEGVDPDETPVTGVVDNKTQYKATISNVVTNNDAILAVEYNHAGNEYTKAKLDIFGAGTAEVVVADEFRDGAIFEARLLDLDDSSGAIGGDGYTVVQNTAQDGALDSITLAATDGSSSTAYIGMKVVVTGGAGIGQYAIVDAYDSGTKVADVVKESDGTAGWDHFVPGTTIVAPNSSSTYVIEPAVSFTAPPRTSTDDALHTTGTWTAGTFAQTTAQYTGISGSSNQDGTGATFDIDKVGRKYYVTLNAAGQNYQRLETITIAGTSVGGDASTHDITITVTSVNVTGGITGFDFEGSARTGLYIVLNGADDSNCSRSYDGTTWSAEVLPSSGAGFWCSIASGLVDDGSTLYTPSYIVAVAEDTNNVAYSADGLTWSSASLPGTFSTGGFKDVAFGSDSLGTVNRFVVVGATDLDVAYSDDGGANWSSSAAALTFATAGRAAITYGMGLFVAVKFNSNETSWSADGITWSAGANLPTGNWTDITFGNGRFIALANNGTISYSLDGKNWSTAVNTGTATGNQISYGQGMFMITTDSQLVRYSENGLVWSSLSLSGTFSTGSEAAFFGNPEQTPQWIAADASTGVSAIAINSIGARARGRASVASEKIFEIRLLEPGSGYTGTTPSMTVTDPNNIFDINVSLRIGNGALSQPTFVNRGTGFIDASAEINTQQSNGFADIIQFGSYIAVRRLTSRPVAGSNVVFGGIPNRYFKLVSVVSFIGSEPGSYTAFLQVSPSVEISDDLANGASVETRIRYSQVRLTGHDFLDVGTGNFVKSNYPNTPLVAPDPTKETNDYAGGRVFFTATDQDGNFRVGDLFAIEQATGVATLNAEAFNIAGLQELSLGQVTLGGNSASITEFSTDPFFTANSDSIVPTQRAIKAYIEAQIGGGGATLNVNTVTAGDIFIGSNIITTVSGQPINITATMNFTGGIRGLPIAYNYMLR